MSDNPKMFDRLPHSGRNYTEITLRDLFALALVVSGRPVAQAYPDADRLMLARRGEGSQK